MTSNTQTELLKDGEAMDLLTERAERWAAKYQHVEDRDRWEADYDAKFESQALQLAERSTPVARRFGAKDWILGVVLWLFIGGTVYLASTFIMQLDSTWQTIFAIFSGLVAVVGMVQSYLETTSAKRAEKRLETKRTWLMTVSRKAAFAGLASRSGGSR